MINAFRVLVLITLPLGLVLLDPPDETQFWNAALDIGHACAFALLGWVTLDLARAVFPGATSARQSARVMTVALGLAVATEFAQSFGVTHSASLDDVFRDLAGAAIVLLLRAPGGPEPVGKVRPLRWLAGVIALAVVMPFAYTLNLYAERNRAFPVLANLDGSRWERRFLATGRATLIPRTETSTPAGLARLDLQAGTYPGLIINEPYPDWRGFQRLVFDLHSDETTAIKVRLRIHDRWHNNRFDDRFNSLLTVERGTQTVSISLADVRKGPARRELDLSNVRGLGLYALQLTGPVRLYVGPFRLE